MEEEDLEDLWRDF